MLCRLETVPLAKRLEAEMEVAQLKMLRFSLRMTIMDKMRRGVGPSEGQHTWDELERKHEREDWGGIDMYGGKMMGVLEEGCWGWSCQGWGNGEGKKGGLWMWWKRTWLRLRWRRRIQKIGTTGHGRSAVATPGGKSRKKRKKNMTVYMVFTMYPDRELSQPSFLPSFPLQYIPLGWVRLPEYCHTVQMRLCLDHE